MVLQWIVLGVFVLIAIVFLRAEHHTRKVKVIVIILIGFLLYFSIMGVFSSDKVDLTSPRGIVNGVYVYFGWIGNAITGLWDVGADTVGMVGNVVKINDSSEGEDERIGLR